MRTFFSLNDFLRSAFRRKRFAATLGVFDGVHRGHIKVINAVIKKARKRRLSSLVITFYPHPVNALNPARKIPSLVSLRHRLALIGNIGINYAIVLHFDKRMAGMHAGSFVNKILSKIPIREIVIGKNFFFGRGQKGTPAFLKKCGYRVSTVSPLKSGGKIISSTRIRKLILKGDLKKSLRLLSRNTSVLGTVIKGHKRGRILGFPTANIDPHHEAIPPSGVYAVKIIFENKCYNGISNIGTRPTFQKKSDEPTIEAHLFNFNRKIYGRDLEILFIKKIRSEKRFRSRFELRKQIQKDEKSAQRLFTNTPLYGNIMSL